MFEELNQHRQAVEEQIQKGFEIGFTGNELEKAHKVGDIHPNGKWVWTQLPSGKFDWRVIKKTAQPATSTGGSTPAPQKPVAGGKTWDKISDFSKPNSVEAQLVAQWGNFARRKDSFYMSTMCQLLEQKFPNVAQWKQTTPNTGISTITAVDAEGKEIAVLDLGGGVNIPKLQTFMDKCSEVKPSKKSSVSSTKLPASIEEAEKMGKVDVAKVNAYKVPTTLYECKVALNDFGKENDSSSYGIISKDKIQLRNAFYAKVGGTSWDSAKTEDEKLERIQKAANELATDRAIVKRISKVQTDLNKLKKQFLADTGRDFTEAQVEEWLHKYETSIDSAAVVRNTWSYAMGRIGSTKATIQVGKGKDKPFDMHGWGKTTPDWRPIGMLEYSERDWRGSYFTVKVPIQSWEDVDKSLRTTENFTLYLYKHPKQ